jgi:hypothetical protein
MTMSYYLIALGTGSALIAFWVAACYPDKGPEDMVHALVHVGLALGVGWFAPDVFNALAARGLNAAFIGIFAVLFPVLFYTFLSGAWFLRITSNAIARYRN